MDALRSFPKDTACGSSGLRVTHLLDPLTSLNRFHGEDFLLSITSLIRLLLDGLLPASLSPLLTLSPLIALQKGNGALRPIAIGEIWRRLASKVCNTSVKGAATDYLQPHQLGVGISDGAPLIVHAAQAVIDQFQADSSIALLKVDFRNAFNTISRQQFLSQTRQFFPSISRWVESCYCTANPLSFGSFALQCSSGVQQGDPLGPLLFSLALHPILSKIRAACPDLLLSAWYLDDGTLIGPQSSLRRALTILAEEAPITGLQLNLEKCVLWWPSLVPSLDLGFPSDLPRIRSSGIDLLGSPLGDSTFAASLISRKIHQLSLSLARLVDLQDPQVEYTLLRASLGLPSLIYSLRTTNPAWIGPELATFDSHIRSALHRILGLRHLPDDVLTQMSLPVALGGLGLPSAASRALPAFLGSVTRTAHAQRDLLPPTVLHLRCDFLPAFESFTATYPQDPPLSLASIEPLRHPQQWLSSLVDSAAYVALLNASSQSARARLLSLQLPFSGTWLSAPPLISFGFRLAPRLFRFLLKYRLGLPLARTPKPCPQCPPEALAVLDISGDHAASCQGKVGRTYRHNRVRDTIFAIATKAGFSGEKEPLHLLPSQPTLRPADVLLHDWANSRSLCLDVAVANPLTRSALPRASSVIGSASLSLARAKRIKYEPLCSAEDLLFSPFVMETYGGFGSDARNILHDLAIAFSAKTEMDLPSAANSIATRLSFACLKALAKAFDARYSDSLLPADPFEFDFSFEVD